MPRNNMAQVHTAGEDTTHTHQNHTLTSEQLPVARRIPMEEHTTTRSTQPQQARVLVSTPTLTPSAHGAYSIGGLRSSAQVNPLNNGGDQDPDPGRRARVQMRDNLERIGQSSRGTLEELMRRLRSIARGGIFPSDVPVARLPTQLELLHAREALENEYLTGVGTPPDHVRRMRAELNNAQATSTRDRRVPFASSRVVMSNSEHADPDFHAAMWNSIEDQRLLDEVRAAEHRVLEHAMRVSSENRTGDTFHGGYKKRRKSSKRKSSQKKSSKRKSSKRKSSKRKLTKKRRRNTRRHRRR